MAKVYIVTEGSYSDYHIVAAFSKEEKAREFIDKENRLGDFGIPDFFIYGSNDREIMELELDSPDVEKNVIGDWFIIEMDKDGNGKILETEFPAFWQAPHLENKDNKLYGKVLAFDEKHAIKLANEYRSLLVCENLWKE
jgi:hypothetical protein